MTKPSNAKAQPTNVPSSAELLAKAQERAIARQSGAPAHGPSEEWLAEQLARTVSDQRQRSALLSKRASKHLAQRSRRQADQTKECPTCGGAGLHFASCPKYHTRTGMQSSAIARRYNSGNRWSALAWRGFQDARAGVMA